MWAAGGVVLAALLARRAWSKGFLGRALIVFQIVILLDAWFSGHFHNPVVAHETLATASAVTFVVLGDLRYFVLLERFGHPEGEKVERWLLRPIGYALIVPIASNVARYVWPGNGRALFLTYEVMFAVLAIGVRVLVLPKRANDAVSNTFAERLTHFEIVQYLAWAGADVVILLGADVGYLLRLVPNLMYYVGFVPWAWRVAPRRLTP
jgi:hypothetical protein